MTHRSLYDEDILLWSEEQAEVIREMGRKRRNLPNGLDVENVAEEIESVGRSELASVESNIQNILVPIIKLAVEPQSAVARHWRSEIVAFHSDLRRRYAPSMRQRIGFAELWRLAREQVLLSLPEGDAGGMDVPENAPLRLDDILAEVLQTLRLVADLQAARRA